MRHLGLFEGIGGFSLAARWAGWETKAWCEWNEFGQKVLKHHFPKAIGHGDITKTDFSIYRGQIDIITGGFPCQPYSQAGKRLGKEDERHLWPEMLRAIKEVQPSWVVGENVLGLVNWSGGLVFHEVQADLEATGYEVFPYVLPACAVNAPHRRDRIWFVAYRNGSSTGPSGTSAKTKSNRSKNNDEQKGWRVKGKFDNGCGSVLQFTSNANGAGREEQHTTAQSIREDYNSWDVMHANSTSKQGEYIRQTGQRELNRSNCRNGINGFTNFPTQSPICSGNDGFSSRLDGITFPKWRNESIKAYGNAIVPQVAFQIFQTINKYEALKK
jgi:DNA (cytosine-5)-methyltransferase 1